MGLCNYPSSRAVYAIDLMLKWDSRPDGERAPYNTNPPYPKQIVQPSAPQGAERALWVALLDCPLPPVGREIQVWGSPPLGDDSPQDSTEAWGSGAHLLLSLHFCFPWLTKLAAELEMVAQESPGTEALQSFPGRSRLWPGP